MFNRYLSNFAVIANKFYSNSFIRPVQYKFEYFQFTFAMQRCKLITRTYCSKFNPTLIIKERNDKVREEKLQSLLQDPKYKAKYDKILLEIEFLKFSYHKIPKEILPSHWLNLLESNSRGQRRSYLEFLWKIEAKLQNRAQKKLIKQAERETVDLPSWNKNTMHLRIRDQKINQFYKHRLINAILYEPPLVFDLSYEDSMVIPEKSTLVKQLLYSFSVNRVHDSPFNFYFCNVKKESKVLQMLHQSMPFLYDEDFPITITSKSYLDIFDKHKLVYLSPHAHQCLETFDHNAVYIVGGLVDKVNPKPVSLEKAKAEGIRIKKFPLSEHLTWGSGAKKNLPINQVTSILLDFKETNDWNVAFRHIPRRKLQLEEDCNMLKNFQRRKKLFLT